MILEIWKNQNQPSFTTMVHQRLVFLFDFKSPFLTLPPSALDLDEVVDNEEVRKKISEVCLVLFLLKEARKVNIFSHFFKI